MAWRDRISGGHILVTVLVVREDIWTNKGFKKDSGQTKLTQSLLAHVHSLFQLCQTLCHQLLPWLSVHFHWGDRSYFDLVINLDCASHLVEL